MVKIVATNTKAYIQNYIFNNTEEKEEFHTNMRLLLSYEVPGAMYSPKFKEGHWDGRVSLYNKFEISFPTGCISMVGSFLKDNGIEYEIQDSRKKPKQNINFETNFEKLGIDVRFYQKDAVNAAIKATRGIVSFATGGGKTICACDLIAKINTVPYLFFVPSKSLLRQTHRELSKYLSVDGKPAHVGFIGSGICDINMKGVNVITYQTALFAFQEIFNEKTKKIERDNLAGEKTKKTTAELQEEYHKTKDIYTQKVEESRKLYKLENFQGKREYNKAISDYLSESKILFKKAELSFKTRLESLKNKAKIRKLIQECQGIIVDEAHIAAEIIQSLCDHAELAYWRHGLSATPFREDNQEIRIQGCLGRKLIEISASDLTELGFLVPAIVLVCKINYKEETEDYRDSYKKYIVNNWERNYRIKEISEEFKLSGIPTLILVEQKEHGYLLESMIKNSVFVPGTDKGEDDPDAEERDFRKRMLNECESNNIILIATQWAYVGIDAPKISGLVLAGSVQSMTALKQMIGRVLRKAPGKEYAYIVDFLDRQLNLRNHTKWRETIYSTERSWKVIKINPTNKKKEIK